MQTKKAYEEPKAGIFYLIPDPKTGKYDLYSEFEEPGNDVTMEQYKQDILSEFGMGDADSIGHVVFEHDLHETMLPRDKAQIEKTLKITMTPQGFKKAVNKKG